MGATIMDIQISGQYHVKVRRRGVIVYDSIFSNGIVDVGKNALLNIGLGAVAKVTWYVGLIGGTPTFSAADTMASHAGWTEYENYDESVRQTWTPAAAASKVVYNDTLMTFTIDDATPVVKGLFVASDDTKGGATGTLWSTAVFSPEPDLTDNDELEIEYKVTIT